MESQPLVILHHLLELVLAEHAVVHEDAGEAVADRAVEEHRGHAAVHAARKAQDDAVISQLFLQLRHRGVHERGSAPSL